METEKYLKGKTKVDSPRKCKTIPYAKYVSEIDAIETQQKQHFRSKFQEVANKTAFVN